MKRRLDSLQPDHAAVSSPTAWRNALAVSAIALLLSACDKAAEPDTGPPPVRPVKTVVVSESGASGIRTFPGRVDASRQVELSFSVAGKLQELAVKEGQEVAAGEVVAKLDPTDFQTVLEDQQARFDRARADFARAEELIKKDFISRQDYDGLQAALRTARAALDAARTNLGYTVLRTPFGGRVAERYVENFTEVQAKQAVMAIQAIETLEVKFNIPENVMRTVRRRDGSRENEAVVARFEGAGDTAFPLSFKEVATRADAETQTFEVTFTLPRPENVNLLPGMTASVDVDMSKLVDEERQIALPVGAVVGDIAKAPAVWVVDENSMTVSPVPVQLGTMSGDTISVTGGLEPGSRVVIAGVSFLRDGMKVRLLESGEQASQ